MRCKHILAAMAAPALFGATSAVAAAEHDIASYQFDNSVTLLSDQRTRGVSDSLMKPALKLSTVFAHESGMVAIADLVNVSKDEFPNGDGLDLTIGGGYRFGNPDAWHFGIGLAAEIFPGAKINAGHQIDPTLLLSGATDPTFDKRDTKFSSNFAVLEINYGPIEGRILDVISDTYRGADTGTVCGALLQFSNNQVADIFDPTSRLNQCFARGDHNSKGTLLYDVDYKVSVAAATTLTLHAGYQKVANFPEANFADYRIGLMRKQWGFEWNAEYVTTHTKAKELYLVQDGNDIRATDNSKVVLSVSRHF